MSQGEAEEVEGEAEITLEAESIDEVDEIRLRNGV